MRNAKLLPNEYAVINAAGDIEILDIHTGEVISNSRSMPIPNQYVFNYEKAVLILQKVKEGKTLNDIAAEPDMPNLSIISNWQRMDRMFAEEMKLARLARAEYHHEKVLDLAGKAANGEYSKDEVPGIKLGADLYKWSAERANPERYGNKVTHEGSTEKPILMRVINTGINRAAKDVIVEVDSKEIPNGSESQQQSKPQHSNETGSTGPHTSSASDDGNEGRQSSANGRSIATGITRNHK